MRCTPEDVMKPDLLSEVVLLGSASLVAVRSMLLCRSLRMRANDSTLFLPGMPVGFHFYSAQLDWFLLSAIKTLGITAR
jgi:hypothetical protein